MTSTLNAMKAIWFAVLIMLLPAGSALGAEPFVRLVVRDVYVHGLAIGLSDVLDQNLVVAGYSGSRLTIDQAFHSEDDLYSSLANRLGGSMARVNDVRLLRPSCLVPGAFAEVPLSTEQISFNFNRVSAAAVLEILANFNRLPYQAKEPPGRSPVLGLRLKRVSSRTVHDAIAMTSGTALRRQGDAYAAVENTSGHQCSVAAEVDAIPGVGREGDCPSRALATKLGVTARCEPLERYAVEELVARGLASIAGRQFVILEAGDRSTFFAKAGDSVGHHLGKISTIDSDGFTVKEIKQDASGFYYFERTRIDYSNKRTTLPPEYP